MNEGVTKLPYNGHGTTEIMYVLEGHTRRTVRGLNRKALASKTRNVGIVSTLLGRPGDVAWNECVGVKTRGGLPRVCMTRINREQAL